MIQQTMNSTLCQFNFYTKQNLIKKTPLIYLFNTKVENELAKYSNTSFNTIMSMFIDAETCSSFIPSKSLFTS